MLRPLIRPLAMRGLLFKERLRSGVSFNPLAPAFQQDPYPKYAELRERDPVHWGVLTKAWVLSRYEHVDAILRDPARFASDERRAGDQAPAYENPLGEERSLLRLDPPDHTRLRTLVTRAFTPRAIESMALRVREIVETQLDPVRDGATVDIMAVLAYPLPVTVIAEMLGVPAEDRDRFKVWSNAVARTLEPTISPHEIGGAVRAAQELAEYFRGIIAARRQHPREDLISGLIAAEEEGDKLTESEMLVMLRLLLVAGNETTTNLIGNGLLALLRNPDQLQRLRDDPSLTESAVEELLRFDSPVQIDARVALEDTEVDGHLIRRGQRT
ncbi:MAG: cytochrome P450, partial [Dehalococcoidia bacterium]